MWLPSPTQSCCPRQEVASVRAGARLGGSVHGRQQRLRRRLIVYAAGELACTICYPSAAEWPHTGDTAVTALAAKQGLDKDRIWLSACADGALSVGRARRGMYAGVRVSCDRCPKSTG